MISAADVSRTLGGKPNGSAGHFVAKCPAHDDSTPSLSIRDADGRVLVHCHAGCTQDEVLEALRGRGCDIRASREVLTVRDFAAAKRLDARDLHTHHVIDTESGIGFEYRGVDGELIGTKYRRALTGERGFYWSKSSKPTLYGLWRLDAMLMLGQRLILCEGESDSLTLWSHDYCALGLPGASMWREAWLPLLPADAQVYVIVEPDRGGESVLAWLAKSELRHRARLVRMPISAKDPNALHCADPGKFVDAFEALLRDAVPWTEPAADGSGKPTDLSGLRLSTFGDLQRAEIVPKIPVFEGALFPGAYLVVGRPKIGKSWLLLQLVMAASDRTAWLGFDCRTPGDVLAIFAEDDDSRIRGRLHAMGYVTLPANVSYLNQQAFMQLAKQYAGAMTFPQFLDAYLAANPAVRMVVVDTEVTCRQIWAGERAASVESPRIVEADYQQTRAFDEMALRRNVVVLLVNHAKKRNGELGDIHELINRSNTALAGCSGSIVLADLPDADPLNSETRDRVLGIRGRDLQDDVVLAVRQRTEDACFENLGPYQLVSQTRNEEEILAVLEELSRDLSPGEYVTAAEIARDMTMKQASVKKALQRMVKQPERRTWKTYRVTNKAGRNGGWRLDPK